MVKVEGAWYTAGIVTGTMLSMKTVMAPLPCASGPGQACVPRIVPRVRVKLWGSRADSWLPVTNPKAMNQRRPWISVLSLPVWPSGHG